MKIGIVNARSLKEIASVENLEHSSTIADVKKELNKKDQKKYPIHRQSLRLESRGKALKDGQTLEELELTDGRQLYYKDLGPQVGWKTVFMAEYAGPLVIYLLFYTRPSLVYGARAATKPYALAVNVAAACWSLHYGKRLLETLFVHRFSHATMPLFNLCATVHLCMCLSSRLNCGYYWGFGAFIAYYINHPLYTPPLYGEIQLYAGLAGFLISEYGNFVIHCVLRDLRPEGSTKRQIPYPSSNPMSQLFRFVSCPNYTYEVSAWISFSVMTQTLPVVFFVAAGFYQMALWAKGKHRNYRKEFKDYPKYRAAIVPFLL